MNAHDNLYNTQCTFAIWAMKTVTDGLLASGGLQANAERVGRRAQRVCSQAPALRRTVFDTLRSAAHIQQRGRHLVFRYRNGRLD